MRSLCLLLFLLSFPALAETGVVVHVTDGDSIRVRIAGQVVAVRVSGIDAPELHSYKCERERELGLMARREAEILLPVGSLVDVRPTGKREKYGRTLATLTLPDGRDYGSILLQLGLAKKYNGGKKESWCQ